jgi:hypothetical protein
MTAQFAEDLLYEGQHLKMCSTPLNTYFSLAGLSTDAIFELSSTALWRRYIGSWEITAGRLYLRSISGTLKNGADASLEDIFPGFPDRVFAHWFTGQLRCPRGRQLEYVHMGFGSTFEKDLLIDVKKGVVTGVSVKENGTADADAAEGYSPGAFLVYGKADKQ